MLEVWDTGIGISKRDQVRIFKEFTRVDAAAGFGMGLGLSIVQRACAHLGHHVAVRSKPGVGSVFSITLPVVAPHPAPQSEDSPVATSSYRDLDLIILLIENDPDVLFAMTQKLESWGASVLACASTAAALEMIADLGMSPDIVLADYQLDGGETGIDAIRALRQHTGTDLPAIIITGHQETDIKPLCAQNDIALLPKPVQLSRLRPLIEWKVRRGAAGYDQSLP